MTSAAAPEALTVEQVRTWASIQAIGSDTTSVLSAAAFGRCADEIERLGSKVCELRWLIDDVWNGRKPMSALAEAAWSLEEVTTGAARCIEADRG